MQTLVDYLEHDLRIISVGLNPSLPSVRDGYYFSGKRNRFWPALNQSTLLQSPLCPGFDAMQTLIERDRIGFTDTVKRPTAGSADLYAADFKQWVPVLAGKLLRYTPRVVWFQGKLAYRNYLKYATALPQRHVPWGMQSEKIGTSRVFVSPNPSPANAAFSQQKLIEWMDQLAEIVEEVADAPSWYTS